MENLITFRIEPDGEEFHAWCPELKGCHTHGKTQNDAIENLRDAIHLYLDVAFDQMLHENKMELAD
jgi:predicted RNase H-like HicB family nuclease